MLGTGVGREWIWYSCDDTSQPLVAGLRLPMRCSWRLPVLFGKGTQSHYPAASVPPTWTSFYSGPDLSPTTSSSQAKARASRSRSMYGWIHAVEHGRNFGRSLLDRVARPVAGRAALAALHYGYSAKRRRIRDEQGCKAEEGGSKSPARAANMQSGVAKWDHSERQDPI